MRHYSEDTAKPYKPLSDGHLSSRPKQRADGDYALPIPRQATAFVCVADDAELDQPFLPRVFSCATTFVGWRMLCFCPRVASGVPA